MSFSSSRFSIIRILVLYKSWNFGEGHSPRCPPGHAYGQFMILNHACLKLSYFICVFFITIQHVEIGIDIDWCYRQESLAIAKMTARCALCIPTSYLP